ncbi:hypothetical protein MSIMFI_05607 [Mycobacterium simulans]|nr:hypothetical protein MSIMFI_05607 [Mycobacterium simulans]
MLAQAGQTGELLPGLARQVGTRLDGYRCFTQHHLVSVGAEFVDRLHAFELHVHCADLVKTLRQRGEKLWGHQQFLLGQDLAAHPLTHYARGVRTRNLRSHHSGAKRGQQRQIAHVTDKDRATGSQQPHRGLDYIQQVPRAGEILNHRIQHHHIEITRRQAVGHIGGLCCQPHPIRPRLGGHLCVQPTDPGRRKVRAPILFTLRGKLGQQQPRAHPNLQHPLRI